MIGWQRYPWNIINFEGKKNNRGGIAFPQSDYCIYICFQFRLRDCEIICKGNRGMIGKAQGIKSLVYGLFDIILRIGGAVAEVCMGM
jgi:hypothetical protein